MKNPIIKYALLLGVSLIFLNSLMQLSIIKNAFTWTIITALRFGLIGGMMMFGINDFLKQNYQKNIYRYSIGIAISLAIGYLGLLLSTTIAVFLDAIIVGEKPQFNNLVNIFFRYSPAILLLAILSPTAFISKANKLGKGIGDDDILDSKI